MPVGTGKTVCAGLVARRALDELGRRTLFLAHREELIHQAATTLSRFGLECAIEMGDQRYDDALKAGRLFGTTPDVCVATVQTMQGNRLLRRARDEFGVIITDEAHHARAKSYRRVFDHFNDYYHLGITATPDRGDGQNLGAVYQAIAYEYSMRQAINDGYLVPIVTARLPCGVNLEDIKTTGGDYNQGELEERIAPHIEALCDVVQKEIGGRQTVIFTPDVGSAEAAASVLDQMGVSARAVSGRMAKVDRRDTLGAFAAREFQAIVCCDLLIEGWDCPAVSCVVVMRPTKQRGRYVQMIGRGTRPYGANGEKPDLLVLDFAWETTSPHELVTSVELFDDSQLDDEVAEIAEELLATGKERDPLKAIDKAEEIKRERNTFKIKLTGKRTSYRKIVYDPVGVGAILGIPIKRGWDFNPASPATEKQLNLLRALKVEQPEGLSKAGAGKLIDRLMKRRQAGLATIKQVEFMVSLGVDMKQAREMTFDQAHQSIDTILGNRRRSA
jgi:superfamily II DNA or RNA helicase